ncbi:hypothetical protein PCANC_17912 [Puccinia coronata f. sp. avenae]|uniref:RING-type domain-containing protein n=1 Tax=Puccinia coronata f. sp. avenae TaxID=200324 RepID=A0A2N5UDW7_9BASI|nr:hypothetical protein PCANC_17912 [Puccinia coronata f. sp. avenae]
MHLHFLTILTKWGFFVQILVEVHGSMPRGYPRGAKGQLESFLAPSSSRCTLLSKPKETVYMAAESKMDTGLSEDAEDLTTHRPSVTEENHLGKPHRPRKKQVRKPQLQCGKCPKAFDTDDTIVKLLPCGDFFHGPCIMNYLSSGSPLVDLTKPCPTCKDPITLLRVMPENKHT